MKSLCIIQARTSSTRLPNKIMLKVNNKPLLQHQIERLKKVKKIDKIVVATTTNKKDGAIINLCKKIKIDFFRGSEEDVLSRYYKCSLVYPEYKTIIRSTSDCPLIDPEVVENVISFFKKNDLDYASSAALNKFTFPDGIDIEIFKLKLLKEAYENAKSKHEREHVTIYIQNKKGIKKECFTSKIDFSHFRFTVDELKDFEVIRFIIENTPPNASYLEHIAFITKYPHIMVKNMNIKRNEGMLKSKNAKKQS